MCGGAPKIKTPPNPAPPPEPAKEIDAAVATARDDTRRRARAAAGYASTLLTGSGGLTAPATTQRKTLLGG